MKIRHARKLKDLTQEDLALSLGVTRATVNRWENGADLPVSKLHQISSATHLPLSYFFDKYGVIANSQNTSKQLLKLIDEKDQLIGDLEKRAEMTAQMSPIISKMMNKAHIFALIFKICQIPEERLAELEQTILNILRTSHIEMVLTNRQQNIKTLKPTSSGDK